MGCWVIRLHAIPLARQGEDGRVAAWAMFPVSGYPEAKPVRVGDIDTEETETIVEGMAKAAAMGVTETL